MFGRRAGGAAARLEATKSRRDRRIFRTRVSIRYVGGYANAAVGLTVGGGVGRRCRRAQETAGGPPLFRAVDPVGRQQFRQRQSGGTGRQALLEGRAARQEASGRLRNYRWRGDGGESARFPVSRQDRDPGGGSRWRQAVHARWRVYVPDLRRAPVLAAKGDGDALRR